MALQILVNTDSGNGLLPDGTKPLPEYMIYDDLSSVRSRDNHLRAISQEIPQPLITEISIKIHT